jgi:sugar O-acyltransferase (sialic acid O-acetyltransferase NeuD family)
MIKFALIGNGGHAKEVMAQMGKKLTTFVEDEYCDETSLPLSKFKSSEFKVMVAISDPIVRKRIIERLPICTKFFSFIHPTALFFDKDIKVGYGSFIGAYSILTTNITIGKHSILNRGNQIGHDCVIGNFLSMMPGSVISGNVKIGDCVYIGTNGSIKEKTQVCSNVYIGSNATVVDDINSEGTYVGVPARFKFK